MMAYFAGGTAGLLLLALFAMLMAIVDVMAESKDVLSAKLNTVVIGIDGQRPPTIGNWKPRRYHRLTVEAGVQIVFNWVGKYHGIQFAKTRKGWRTCKSEGAEALVEPSLGGSYTLDTSQVEPNTSLLVFCPVHCDADEYSGMKVEIKVTARRPCRVARGSAKCAMKPNCTWVGGKCRPLVPF
jgi:hypothetical protein